MPGTLNPSAGTLQGSGCRQLEGCWQTVLLLKEVAARFGAQAGFVQTASLASSPRLSAALCASEVHLNGKVCAAAQASRRVADVTNHTRLHPGQGAFKVYGTMGIAACDLLSGRRNPGGRHGTSWSFSPNSPRYRKPPEESRLYWREQEQ